VSAGGEQGATAGPGTGGPPAGGPAREVLAVKFGHRVTSRSESYLNYHLYGEPDADLDIDYFFWVIADRAGVWLVDTGFGPEVAARRGREHYATAAQVLPGLGIDPADVTAIVISHAHWDHTGNIGQFPNAELVLTEAEYAFWTSSLAERRQFAAHCEPGEISLLRQASQQDRVTLFSGQYALAPGIQLTEVGGHTPGQLIVSVATPAGGTAVLASDALHFYEEVERDRPFAIIADLPAMYRAYDTLAQLAAQPGTQLVAGHDPGVRARFAPGTRSLAASAAGLAERVQVTDLTRPRDG
jgi:glyoxylase-like metal-dependent hydrolase (beta-lactamase superfamily II)